MHLAVGTPMYGGYCCSEYVKSMLALKGSMEAYTHEMTGIFVGNESLIHRARNKIAHIFLETTNASHLLFMDADQSFEPADIVKLIKADKGIIAGCVPMKGLNWDRIKQGAKNNYGNLESLSAGQLLTEIITKGMRLQRTEVYIANVIKCRPPGNRNPEPDEVESCEPFLLRQVELIRPEVIVALGKFAAQTLLRTKTPITQLRGRWFDYHGIKLMPTFHPAYLLRNPGEKRLVWQDIQQVMQVLGLPPPRAS